MTQGAGANVENAMWVPGGWQMMALLEAKVKEPRDCARRGCEKKRSAKMDSEEEKKKFMCEMCDVTGYCSEDCLTGYVKSTLCCDAVQTDKSGFRNIIEHKQICGWVHMIEDVMKNVALRPT